ncbi:MAG: hypothetical protein CSA05_02935 [Bacteroidia bacterium]|nr:MAG: hypothetical protein CSA05_02935 [Bacteroidia bacterium]
MNTLNISAVLLQMSGSLSQDEYFMTLYLPILIWIILVLIVVFLSLWKYTFGHWTAENPNPYQDETLGLPRGIFRGLLTITLLFVTVLLEVVHVRLGKDELNFREFLVAFQMMIAFYFGSKVMHHVTSVDGKKVRYKTDAQVEVKKTTLETESATSISAGGTGRHTSSPISASIEEKMAEMYSEDEANYSDDEAAG